MSHDSPTANKVADAIADALSDRIQAIYTFGLEYGKGPRAPSARLLVLVDRIDAALLDALATAQKQAREDDVALRVDTFANLQASTDVFPVLTFELLDNRTLLHGKEDLLSNLELHPKELRMGIEHSLRATQRDLMRAYLDSPDDRARAIELRRAARRTLMMLEASLVVVKSDAPSAHTPEKIMAATREAKILTGDRSTWDTWFAFGDYGKTLEHGALVKLHANVLLELQTLIQTVDALEA